MGFNSGFKVLIEIKRIWRKWQQQQFHNLQGQDVYVFSKPRKHIFGCENTL